MFFRVEKSNQLFRNGNRYILNKYPHPHNFSASRNSDNEIQSYHTFSTDDPSVCGLRLSVVETPA